MARALMHGWVALPTRGDILFEHGLPRRVWVRDLGRTEVERLVDEICELTGFHVTLGPWVTDEDALGMETAIQVDAVDIDLVLGRLAVGSAETFVDRYQKAIGPEDMDYDDEAYAQDIQTALEACSVGWAQIDAPRLKEDYRRALHLASEEIAGRAHH